MSKLKVSTISDPDNDNTAITVDSSGNITVAQNATFSGSVTGISSYSDSDALDLFNASGSAPVYACRAWCVFNGTSTPSISASGNVSSITDNGTGYYSVNFTTAMPDSNYAASITPTDNAGSGGSNGYSYSTVVKGYNSATTSALTFGIGYPANATLYDNDRIMVVVHR
jgi:hypothetical protein